MGNSNLDPSVPGEEYQAILDEAPYKFNFDQAVAKARADYPELTQNVVFIDLASPDARKQIMEEIAKTSPPPSPEQIADFMKEFDKRPDSEGFVNNCGAMTFLFANSKPLQGFFSGRNPDKAAAYSFTHELGHIVVQGGRCAESGDPAETLWTENFSENVADSFAMITGLSEGWLTINDVLRISLERAVNGWISKDLKHITTIALDNIILRAESIAPSSLTPVEIAAIAHSHALDFTLPRTSLKYTFNEMADISPADRLRSLESGQEMAFECLDAQESLGKEMAEVMQKHARIIAEACMEEPHTSASFHLYGRIVAKIFRTGKIEGVTIDTNDPYWDKVRKDLVEKSYAAGLSDIFKIEHPDVPKPAEKVLPPTHRGNHFKNQI